MASADALMLSGVLRYCSDCGGERIFVEPDVDPVGAGESASRAEFACTDCGAALFIDPAIFPPSGVETSTFPRGRQSVEAAHHLAG
jgi:hypothetical protein